VSRDPALEARLAIRPATAADAASILGFIRELAHYEREPDAVVATEADLLRDGWGLAADGVTPLLPARPVRFAALMAELDGVAAGFALYFDSYSTWLGHHGIRLEDLYVTPALRGRGIGKALLARLASIAIEQGCLRLEWDVLDWNEPAIAVYRRIGATMQNEWRVMRLAGEALAKLAASDGAKADADSLQE
jgi:GNAT superfamily N-acetyltransferase